MIQAERPLSPHLQIYKWPLAMATSILHRATGIALAVGTVFLVWWLVAAAMGEQAYAQAQWFFGSWLGVIFLFGWCFSFFYHLCNGIRHLVWDAGYGFEKPDAYRNSVVVIAAAVILTVVAFAAGMMARG
ncbi:MAG TPA: succinate dehydrogenase, cytochrome b556 subunit [Stellaceae bacterium]|jgi:succinate dehydrogenase / fumarate reductase cytochrome b subunit